MNADASSDVLAGLHRLPKDTGGLIAEAIAPVDEAIRTLGIPYRSAHFAEDCRDWNPNAYAYYQAHASRFVFALEAAEQKVNEYSLCAAEGPDGQCGLYVSICESHTETDPAPEGSGWGVIHRVVIDRVYLARPSDLSLSLQAQMLDELHQGNFLRAYRQHVERVREGQADEPMNRYWLPGRKG